ncbi:hypothetical protein [Helicobacter sp.]|uniref:hypothetical protein n=1 Tax=Helicobacter sp. TaxID=218 RepID=UPI0037535C47|nr:hypothetical protein [Helicobacter sp.]
MAEVLENRGNTNNQDIKQFLRLLWENKKVFGICVVACVVGAYAYAFVKFKPMYDGVGVIDTGYILNDQGAKIRIVNTPEIAKELEVVFIESRKFATEDISHNRFVKDIQIDPKNQNLPFVRVLVRGETQEDAKGIFAEVLAYVQEKNKDRLEKHRINLEYLTEAVEATIANIQGNTLPYLDSKISHSNVDIEELKKELKKESLNPKEYQTISNYMGQLQVSIDSAENSKMNIQNQTLLELEQQLAKYKLMSGEDSIKNASYITENISSKPTLGVRTWIVGALGLFSGVVLSVLIISLQNLYTQIKREGL